MKTHDVVLVLLLLRSFGVAKAPEDVMNSISNAVGGTQDLSALSSGMESFTKSIGDFAKNTNRPDFSKEWKDVMSLVDEVPFDDHKGGPPMNIEQHVEDAIGAFGPMACMAGDFPPDSETMGLMMGGLGGAMFGEILSESATTSSYDMEQVFSELGAISGIIGSAAGAFNADQLNPDMLMGSMPDGMSMEQLQSMMKDGMGLPEGMTIEQLQSSLQGGMDLPEGMPIEQLHSLMQDDFNPQNLMESLPDADMIEDLWAQAQQGGMELPDGMTIEQLQSMMQESAAGFGGMLSDFESMSSSLNEKLFQRSGRLSQLSGNRLQSIPGVNSKIQNQAIGLISATSMMMGAIGDAVRVSTGKQHIYSDKKELEKEIKYVFEKISNLMKLWRKKKLPGEARRRSLSEYSQRRLRELATNIAKSNGHIGAHLKRNYDANILRSGLKANAFTGDLTKGMFSVKPGTIKKHARMLTNDRKGRMSYNDLVKSKKARKGMENCMGTVMPIMSEIEKLQKMMMPERKLLNWDPPFHANDDKSWLELGLPKYVIGDLWNEEWKFDEDSVNLELPGKLSASDFSNSFVPDLLQDPEIVDFINYANRMEKTSLIDYLKGGVSSDSIDVGALREFPLKVLGYIPDKEKIPVGNVLSMLQHGRRGIAFEGFSEYVGELSNSYIMEVLQAASTKYWEGTFHADLRMAEFMNQEASKRVHSDEFNDLFKDLSLEALIHLLCPFGIFDYVYDKYTNLSEMLSSLAECVEFSLENGNKNPRSLIKLQYALGRSYASGISIQNALNLGVLINFLPPESFSSMEPHDVLNWTSQPDSVKLLPRFPGFKKLTTELARIATSVYAESNNTDIIEKLGPVACGLRGNAESEHNLHFTTAAKEAIKDTCGIVMKKEKPHRSAMMKRCMRNKKCQMIGGEITEKRGMFGKLRDKKNFFDIRENFQNIMNKSANEMLQEFDKYDDTDSLSREEKKQAIRKLIEDDAIINPSALTSVRGFVSALPADYFMTLNTANVTNLVMENPRAVQEMSTSSKAVIVSKLASNFSGFLENVGRLRSLTSKIPSDLLRDVDVSSSEALLEIVTSVNWVKSQAMVLANEREYVTLNDIRKMGTLATGLTCHDVRNMRLSSMLQIANELDASIGKNIPFDLAECVSLKLYLYLQSKYDKNIPRNVFAKIPPPFVIFFPSDLLHTLMSNCKGFFNRISSQLEDMQPHTLGQILFEELADSAYYCMSQSFSGPPPDFIESMPDKMPLDVNEAYLSSMGRMSKSPDNSMKSKDHSTLGNLLCRIKPSIIKYIQHYDFSNLLMQMHSCIRKIKKMTLETIHSKIMEEFGSPNEWTEKILQIVGPFVSTMEKSKMEMIPDEIFAANARSMIPPSRSGDHLIGDKTANIVDVQSLFQFQSFQMGPDKIGEGPPSFNKSFDPLNLEELAQVLIQKIWRQDSPTVEDIQLLGPSVLPYLATDLIPTDTFMTTLSLFGQINIPLNDSTEEAMKEKIASYASSNSISKYSDDMLQELNKLAPMFTSNEIEDKFEITKLETLAILGKARWRTAAQVKAVLELYLGDRNLDTLTGPELVAMGNIHCLLDEFSVDALSTDSLKFALREIGKLRCFEQDQIDLYKSELEKAFGTIDAAVLREMGVLAAGFTADELASFGKPKEDGIISPLDLDLNLIPYKALRVIPASRIVSGLDDSQYARLGTVNAGTLLERKDIFDELGNRTKNALFAAAFGLNAGIYAGYIQFARNFDENTMRELEKKMEEMMLELKHAMELEMSNIMPTKKPLRKRPTVKKPSQVFGLKDLSQATRPTPPPLAIGLTKKDLASTFDKKYLKDRVVVEMLNSAASSNMEIIEVIKGESSLNDISDEEITKIPPKLLQGLKKDAIQQMAPEKLALLLDSDEISKDPTSLSKTLTKLDLEQFKKALAILSEKMKSSGDTWRPPITTQEAVSKRFFKFNHGSQEQALQSFLGCMCPFSAGIQPRRIMDIPQDENYVGPVIECFDDSYKDLDSAHRRQLLNWVNIMWKKEEIHVDKAILLRNFLLDVPTGYLESAFTSNDVYQYVEQGALLNLDTSHKKFSSFSKFIVKATIKFNISKFADSDFMENLGRAKCEIRLKKVRNVMDSDSLRSMFDYTMKHCKDHNDEIQESLEECKGEDALRLKRCELLEEEIKKAKKEVKQSQASNILKKVSKKAVVQRVGIKEYQMMKDVVDVYIGDKDLTALDSSEVRQVAGAIGALKPNDIDKIPDEAILDNMDVLKNNTKLTRRQKKKLFIKIQSAGFQLNDSSSLTNLGELMTSVPPKEFKKLTSTQLRESLSELKKHSDALSSAQKRVIVETLNQGAVEDLLNADLGDLVTEIPLADLESLETVEMEKLKNKPWRRGQAANLVRKFRESKGLSDTSLNVEDIRTMGHASVGITCMDVMKILDDETYDAAQALAEETERSLSLDMNECVSNKLHYALQVLNGENYISNDTDPDLSTTLSFIPEDVAMMLPTQELEKVPSSSCLNIMENVGNAFLDLLPSGTGDIKREKLANISYDCIRENSLVSNMLEENEVVTLGNLVCDLGVDEWKEFSSDAFASSIPMLRECFDRLSASQLDYIEDFVRSTYGVDSSQWGLDVVENLGPLVSTLDKSIIGEVDSELFYEMIDDIMPPEMSEDLPAFNEIHFDAFYEKAVDVILTQRIPQVAARRRRRQADDSPPTYDEITVLGPGNVAWSVEQLNSISEEDFKDSLETLGSISKWSYDQRTALLDRMKQIYGASSEWDDRVIGSAQYLLQGLSYTEKSQLTISDIETCTSLSEIEFTNDERSNIIDSYMQSNGLDYRSLSSSDLAGFGSLVCGIDPSNFLEIPVDAIKDAIKNLGNIDCYSQTQLDIIKQIFVTGQGTTVPTAPELDEMGTIAAGLTEGDLSQLPLESIAFINPAVFMLIPPSRIKDGMSLDQLSAAGAGNIAVLMLPEIFDVISPNQRNALRVATYGDDAVLEEVPEDITEDSVVDQVVQIDLDLFGDNSGDEITVPVASSTTRTMSSTTETSTTADASSVFVEYLLLFLSLFVHCLLY